MNPSQSETVADEEKGCCKAPVPAKQSIDKVLFICSCSLLTLSALRPLLSAFRSLLCAFNSYV